VREFRCDLWFERSAEARAYWFLLCPRSLGPSLPKFMEPFVTECMGPSVPTCRDHLCPGFTDLLGFILTMCFIFIGTFCVRKYAFECRSVRMFCFHSSELCYLEFICFLYKAYDHLCARVWLCGIFMLRLSFYFPSWCLYFCLLVPYPCFFYIYMYLYLILFRLIDQ